MLPWPRYRTCYGVFDLTRVAAEKAVDPWRLRSFAENHPRPGRGIAARG